jgi:hypothetical protein
MADEAMTFMVEDAQLIFKNFTGVKGQYNKEGEKSFCVILDDKVAPQMMKDGWNVKFLKPREEGDEPTPYIQIKVNFDNRPPRIVMITSTTRNELNAKTVEMLDWADVETADMIARAYPWNVNGKTGVAAYLKSLFVTVAEDELERKYAINEPEE